LKAITWRETRERSRRDRARLRSLLEQSGQRAPRWLGLYPPYICVWLHRLSHLLHSHGRRWLARLVWQTNLMTVGADISPLSDLGGGLVVLNPVAVVIFAKAGRDLTVMASCGLGALPSREDIGAGPGLPWLGDEVELAPLSGVLGPVRIGNRVRLGPGCIVTKDIPDDTIVSEPAVRAYTSPKPR
jgi:serine O-acetyltransferase